MQYFLRKALGHNPPVFHNQHALAQRKHLFAIMGDVKNRNPEACIPRPQVGNNPGLGHRVQRSQRLIEQQRTRTRHQRSRQRHPLTFAAGNLARRALRQLRYVERLQYLADALLTFRGIERRQAILNVPDDRHVRKERERLKQISHMPLARRKVDVRG